MKSDQIQKLRARLAQQGNEIAGAALSALIRNDFRELVPSPISPKGWLLRLVNEDLADMLQPIGRRGMDILYAICSTPNATHVPLTFADAGAVWKAFASPLSMAVIFVDPAFVSLRVGRATGAAEQVMGHTVSCVTRVELRRLASEFLDAHSAGLGDDALEKLRSLLSSDARDSAHYYWFQLLRSTSASTADLWNSERREGIVRLFRHRLTGIDGIQEGDISRLCDQLRRSQLASVKTRSTQVAGRDDASFVASAANSMDVRPPQQRSRKVTAPNDIDLLRAVIADAISHADYDTLAKVTLPAGLMFDTFRQRALKGEI